MNPSLDSDYRKEDRQILITYGIFGVMLLSLLIMAIIFAFRVDAAPKLEAPTKATAAEIADHYQANPVAAARRYQNRHLELSGRIQEINFAYRWNKPEHLYIAVIPDSMSLTPDTPQEAKTFCVIGKTSVSLHNQANPGQPVQDRRELVTSLQKANV